MCHNPVPHCRNLDLFILREFTEDNKTGRKHWEKGEKDGYQHFLHNLQCFLPFPNQPFNF